MASATRNEERRPETAESTQWPTDFLEHLCTKLGVNRGYAEAQLGHWIRVGLQQFLITKHFGSRETAPMTKLLREEPLAPQERSQGLRLDQES